MRQIGGRTILERVIARLKPQCDGLILNANGDPARFAGFGLPVIPDTVENFPGPLAGILAGLDWAAANRPEVAWVLSAAADCPFLPRDLVARLHRARAEQNAQLAVAASDGQSHPVIGLWSVALARGTSPRAGRRRHPQDRPLDRALPARHRDVAGRRRSIRSSTPTPWTTSRRPSGWRRWTGAKPLSARHPEERPLGRVSNDTPTWLWFETRDDCAPSP